MKFELSIDTSNDAFEDPGEIARILRSVADQVDGYGHVLDINDHFWLRDLNGNTVGIAKVVE